MCIRDSLDAGDYAQVVAAHRGKVRRIGFSFLQHRAVTEGEFVGDALATLRRQQNELLDAQRSSSFTAYLDRLAGFVGSRNTLQGNLGEIQADLQAFRNGYINLTANPKVLVADVNSPGGVDHIWFNPDSPGAPLIVADSKTGAFASLGSTNAGFQLSERWVNDRLVEELGEAGRDSFLTNGLRVEVRDNAVDPWQEYVPTFRTIETPAVTPPVGDWPRSWREAQAAFVTNPLNPGINVDIGTIDRGWFIVPSSDVPAEVFFSS